MNKLTILTLSIAATATVFTLPLAAQNIIVSPNQHDAFVTAVSEDLDNQLDHVRGGPRWDPAGIAQIRFQAGEDGRPHAVTVYRSSGDNRYDRAAVRAIKGLTSLSPAASDVLPNQTIQANIIVARSQSELDRLSKRLARDEAARLASSPRERTVLALTMASRPVS